MTAHPLPHIRFAQNRITGIADNPDKLPSLFRTRRGRKKAESLMGRRLMKVSRRRDCEAVIIRLLHLTDPRTCTVQSALSAVAKNLSMNRRTLDRVIRDIRDAGLCQTVRRPTKKIDGKIIPVAAAIRRWSSAFIKFLGIGKLWEEWRMRRAINPPRTAAETVQDDIRTTAAKWRNARPPPRAPDNNPGDYLIDGKPARSWREILAAGKHKPTSITRR